MLPQVHRLPAKEFPSLLRYGVRVHTDVVDIRYAKRMDTTRVGFIITKSVDKRATRRNRLKRVLSEQIRLTLGKRDPRIDAIFIMRKPISQDKRISEVITPLFQSIVHSI